MRAGARPLTHTRARTRAAPSGAMNRRPRPHVGALLRAAAVGACLALSLAAAGAHAATVDGISDQSLPNWDGSFGTSAFAQAFRAEWVASGHISYARYVLQWNAFANRSEEPYAHYAQEFERWWADVRSLDLIPVVAFYNYCPAGRVPRACARALPNPASEAAYSAAIEDVLATFRPGAVEAWNEPNDDEVPEALAAGFANSVSRWCASNGCTTIAGDFLDARGAAAYAARYIGDVDAGQAPPIVNWGMHPYYALNSSRGGGEAEAIHDELRGVARTTWITEIGAYYCDNGVVMGEAQQRARAQRLVSELAPKLEASHTFYYEFLRANREQAPCESGKRQEDSALYRPDDGARAAASVILEGGAAAHLGGARERAEYDARLAGAAASRPPAWWSGFSAAIG